MKASLVIEGTAADIQAFGAPTGPAPAAAPAPSILDRLEDASLHTTGRVRLKGLAQPLDLEVTVTLK
jgi:hypothetical protein